MWDDFFYSSFLLLEKKHIMIEKVQFNFIILQQ